MFLSVRGYGLSHRSFLNCEDWFLGLGSGPGAGFPTAGVTQTRWSASGSLRPQPAAAASQGSRAD